MREDDYLPPEQCLAADERPIANRTRCITDYELGYAPYDEQNEAYKTQAAHKSLSRRKHNASRNFHRF